LTAANYKNALIKDMNPQLGAYTQFTLPLDRCKLFEKRWLW